MSEFWDNQDIIGTIIKNKREEIVLSKCKRKDKEYVDIRIYSKTANSGDVHIPTSKGINLDIDKKDRLIDLLNQI